jgi:hypothetical protein
MLSELFIRVLIRYPDSRQYKPNACTNGLRRYGNSDSNYPFIASEPNSSQLGRSIGQEGLPSRGKHLTEYTDPKALINKTLNDHP